MSTVNVLLFRPHPFWRVDSALSAQSLEKQELLTCFSKLINPTLMRILKIQAPVIVRKSPQRFSYTWWFWRQMALSRAEFLVLYFQAIFWKIKISQLSSELPLQSNFSLQQFFQQKSCDVTAQSPEQNWNQAQSTQNSILWSIHFSF